MLLVIRSVRAMMTPFNGGFHEDRARETDRETETDNVSFSLLFYKSVSNNAMHTGIWGAATRYLSVICY